MTRRALPLAAVAAAGALLAACATSSPPAPAAPAPVAPSASATGPAPAAPAPAAPAPAADPAGPATLIAVGDIARCDSGGDERTAAITAELLKTSPSAPVLALGDLAYPNGSARDFARCYRPTWGRFDARVRPVPGNHEYRTGGASGYFAYFGSRAGSSGKGWYSYDVGAWHVVALNSNCDHVGCGPRSTQVRWLQSDLTGHRSRCVLAYWHHPRFSSGQHGSTGDVAALWSTLERAGADVVLSGHDHDYERFAPQRTDGTASTRGIRQFVVGTGGAEHRAFATRIRNSQRRITGVDAVLRLELGATGYRWALVGPAGASRPLDTGTASCS